MDVLIHISKNNKVPVARLDCCFGTNQQSDQQEHTGWIFFLGVLPYLAQVSVVKKIARYSA
jgi:hypothetical protein